MSFSIDERTSLPGSADEPRWGSYLTNEVRGLSNHMQGYQQQINIAVPALAKHEDMVNT